MKLPAAAVCLLVVALAGCSAESCGGGSSFGTASGGGCEKVSGGGTGGSAACAACESSKCSSELTAAFGAHNAADHGGACGPYEKCLDACCFNPTCMEDCGLAPKACDAATHTLLTCVQKECGMCHPMGKVGKYIDGGAD